jgi:sulfur-carrier protein adenylyltransferase/sulfurtransferase
VNVEVHDAMLTRDNALDIIARYDFVVDGTDNFPTRYLVNDACVLLGKRYVYGSIFRFEGQVSVFDAQKSGCYRCLFREPPPPGMVPSCAEAGVLGVLPGVIGSLQALEAIKLILDAGDALVGRLVLFDAMALRFRELKLRKNPDCPVCGEHPTITGLIDYEEFCGMRPEPIPSASSSPLPEEITPVELKARLDRGDALTLLDVREDFELEMANLEPLGARHIPMGQIGQRAQDELDPSEEIVVICRSGARSNKVARALREAGYPRVLNLTGGIVRWSAEVDPSIPRY